MTPICNICLDEISDHDKNEINIVCKNDHFIHKKCMKSWLIYSEKGICPGGCQEKLDFNLNNILLDDINVSSNRKQIVQCDQAISLLRIYIQLYRLILIDLAKIQPKVYSTPMNIFSHNSEYVTIIDGLEEIIEVYVELKYSLIQLNNIKISRNIDTSINYENIRLLITSKKNNESHLNIMREKLLDYYNSDKLEQVEKVVNGKIEYLSQPKYQNSNKSKTILRIFRHISISLPTLKTALDTTILQGDNNYVNVEDIIGILSLHRIVSIYYKSKIKNE